MRSFTACSAAALLGAALLLAAPPARAQGAAVDTVALYDRLGDLRRQQAAVEEVRDALYAQVVRYDEISDSLTYEIAAASSAIRGARAGATGPRYVRATEPTLVYAGPDWSAVRLGRIQPGGEVEVLGRATDGVTEFLVVQFGGRPGYVPSAAVEGRGEAHASGGAGGSPAGHAHEHTGGAATHGVVASRHSVLFHLPTCRHAELIAPESLLTYGSAEEAEADGRRLCRVCNEALEASAAARAARE
jgi:hypothetical protein